MRARAGENAVVVVMEFSGGGDHQDSRLESLRGILSSSSTKRRIIALSTLRQNLTDPGNHSLRGMVMFPNAIRCAAKLL